MTERELTLAEEAERLAARLGYALDDFRANGPAPRDSVAAVLTKHDQLHAEQQKADLLVKTEAVRSTRR
ncbi:hypothetical protein [Beijerinckia sp. L45]|uniref:hypothetical protein n=1 Tax=Beijerinckia sp. L45 TaxID=1641855 RepID=UPI00131E9002|nr:hypothetical protein [Beijerinckia sp. L45]